MVDYSTHYFILKEHAFLILLPNFKPLRTWKVAFFTVFIRDYAVAITQTCSGSDVKAKIHIAYRHINIKAT